jgi:hypothetical protein
MRDVTTKVLILITKWVNDVNIIDNCNMVGWSKGVVEENGGGEEGEGVVGEIEMRGVEEVEGGCL